MHIQGKLAFCGIVLLLVGLGIAQESPATIKNSLGMMFARIPAGKFVMGSPDSEPQRGRDETSHTVEITCPFYCGVHEVTQDQFIKLMGSNPSWFAQTGGGKERLGKKNPGDHPVETVTWHQAVAFCAKLSAEAEEKEAGRKYRLPTEAEWEYACRAGTATPLHYGIDVDSYKANFNGLAPFGNASGGPFFRSTVRVGDYKPNAFGLHDMHGNVQEWVQDWYDAGYYQVSPKQDPTGPKDGTMKVLRGGGWPHSAKACRSAIRNKQEPDRGHYSAGFRVVMDFP